MTRSLRLVPVPGRSVENGATGRGRFASCAGGCGWWLVACVGVGACWYLRGA